MIISTHIALRGYVRTFICNVCAIAPANSALVLYVRSHRVIPEQHSRQLILSEKGNTMKFKLINPNS
ncbi:hypothetical protein [Coleofasciculus chthonoplastes]|uniref:hypothetical protein n=1 Tax=Coleofasciculus chthonoplastes TaxID=64178 RepID=UPI003302C1CA